MGDERPPRVTLDPRGAHPREWVRPPDFDEFRRWQEAAHGMVRMVTLAPEWPGATRYIERLTAEGVVVSIGHTAAGAQEIADAVRAGLSAAGIKLSDADFAGLLTETVQHATRITARAATAEQLDELKVSRLVLPTIADGVDLGSLYELSESLAQQGVR